MLGFTLFSPTYTCQKHVARIALCFIVATLLRVLRLLNAADIAAMESWNHSLKVEAIHGERFVTREAARAHVFEYIEIYYNRKRPHSTLGYLSPEVFEARQAA